MSTIETNRAGALPPLPDIVGQTLTLQQAVTAFRIMDDLGDISCFDGPAGTGKTTACSYAAAQSSRSWRYCVLPLSARPKELIATVYEAVLQRPARGTERVMSSELTDRLSEQDIGLIADEVHHVGLPGAQQLRYLWDAAARHGTPFPLLLIGCNVRQELNKAEEVRGRVARQSIRAWHQIAKHIRYLPSTDPSVKKAAGLTRDDARILRAFLGDAA
ncbi:AAA family ATPase [Geodermatophilus sp. SYSU D00691]